MYHPRRASKRRLEGAPPYVLSVYDAGPKHNDRYTVFFGWPIWQESMERSVPFLGFNECPTSPNTGVSMWGELERFGGGPGKPISWADLPEHLQKHVIARANYPEEIKVGRLVRLEGAHKTGRDMWGFEPPDGIGYFDKAFLTKKEAREYARRAGILLIPAPVQRV